VADRYVPQEIEPKWQERWKEDGLYATRELADRPKFYAMTMYPYPSGNLHIGHWYAMAPSDTRARYIRMKGYNVFFPVGFDAFGLPAENAAIKHGIHPYQWTRQNIENMRRQLRSMGAMWAWDREAVTCEPGYYKWTQWFFLKFYEKGLAYRTKAPVDWCPSCNTSLAREQVWGEDRHCERCGTPVVKKDLNQWLFRITDYAEELLDFSKIEWPERVVSMQTNWIGRSEGVEFDMAIAGHDATMRVFTTRPDTVFGMTFAVLAPEHPLVDKITAPEQREAVEAYKLKASRQSEVERLSTEKVRDGVFIGAYAVNPMNDGQVPIFIADYVLMGYGTGAIMAVPGHDERDFDFAERHNLPIPVVIAPPDWDGQPLAQAYVGEGTMVNSGQFDGLPSVEGVKQVTRYMAEHGIGEHKINYRIHDWLISRQRYWGAPIPIVYCERCGAVPVPYADLPVLLPDDAEFLPTGESPLKYHEGFLNTTCPQCGGPALRETDTMDTFLCSSWYQYAYISPYYDGDTPFDPAKGKYWLPVDQYTGGIEHATMHLLYTRFFTKAMRDIGVVDFDEPMLRLFNQGIILGEDSEKMSKSRGNVVDPDNLVSQYGADAFRAYLMFIGPWEEGGPWNSQGIEGITRFLNRVWSVVLDEPRVIVDEIYDAEAAERALLRITHQTIRKATSDMEAFKFNTMLAALMEFNNYLIKAKNTPIVQSRVWDEAVRTLVLLLAPSTPHLTDELWHRLGGKDSVHVQSWPVWNEALAAEDVVTIAVQVNGKVRDRFDAPTGISEDEAVKTALSSPRLEKYIAGKQVVKIIFVPAKLVNIVVR